MHISAKRFVFGLCGVKACIPCTFETAQAKTRAGRLGGSYGAQPL